MVATSNWTRLAAAQTRTELIEFCQKHSILSDHVASIYKGITEERLAEIIQQYCPFEPDVAYTPINTGVVAQMAQGVEELLKVCQFISNARLGELHPELRDAVVGLRVLMEKNRVLLQCTQCGKRTIPLEAAQRNGCCDVCGGFFVVTID